MRIYEITESRKNPELNPKVSINDAVIDRLRHTTDEIVPGVKNLFVSFTEIEKLGINPQGMFNTPVGIYSYPAKYVEFMIGKSEGATELPFAGEHPWANIFKANGNIINLAEMSKSETNEYYRRIRKLWKSVSPSPSIAYEQIDQIISEAENSALVNYLHGGVFWYVTMEASKQYFSTVWNSSLPIVWNKLFRSIGIDGFVDTGAGIVHKNEPTQAVFLSKRVLSNVERVANKYSPDVVAKSARMGSESRNTAQKIRDRYEAMPTDQAIRSLSMTPMLLQYIKNPEVRSHFIDRDPRNIRYIKNPSRSEILQAISKNVEAASYVIDRLDDQTVLHIINELDYPFIVTSDRKGGFSLPLQVAAVRRVPSIVFLLHNPHRRVIQAALDSQPNSADALKIAAMLANYDK